ncbi:MAG: hypothetical protein RLZZ200_1658 [Pseudomonadota bacterium]
MPNTVTNSPIYSLRNGERGYSKRHSDQLPGGTREPTPTEAAPGRGQEVLANQDAEAVVPTLPEAVPVQLDPLTADEVRRVLVAAGWPLELQVQGAAVAFCESRWIPGNSRGPFRGLFGIAMSGEYATGYWRGWFLYFGVPEDVWPDPVWNARVALMIVNYNLERGQPAFGQWDPACRRSVDD